MTRICLVRHGETDWNMMRKLQGQQNTSLNTRGRTQAEVTGAYLAENYAFDLLLTSPLQRAKETAEIINQYLKLQLIEKEGLMERGFGVAEGMYVEEVKRKFPNQAYPGIEGKTAFYNRVMECFQNIAIKYEGKHLLVVSHGLVINLLLSVGLNEEINYKQTKLMNGCLNFVEFTNERWNINIVNQVDHFKLK